jgi:hypothetical protein
MENQNNKANVFQHKRQGKDTNFQAQMKRILNRLFNRCVQHTRLLPILGSVRTDMEQLNKRYYEHQTYSD